jgi:hypothetical protein
MRNRILLIVLGVFLFLGGYVVGNGHPNFVFAQSSKHGGIPKAYGHIVSAVVTPGGTSMVFEDSEGTIRFVTITGEVETELTRN